MTDLTQPPPRKRYTWVWIIVGILISIFVIGAGCVTFTVLWFRQNMDITETSDANAAAEFDTVRAKFAGQLPLIEMRDDRPRLVEERLKKASTTPLKTMHVMAWDSDESQIVRFSLPFWLLRLNPGPIRIGNYADGWDDSRIRFTIEDLERSGPGLVLDATERNEGRVLVWVE